MSAKKVAVIGSREPTKLQDSFAQTATRIALKQGYYIATGAAEGIDYVGIKTCLGHNFKDRLLIYLPWKRFNSDLVPNGSNVILYEDQET